MKYLCRRFILLFILIYAIRAKDLLNGNGLFLGQEQLDKWQIISLNYDYTFLDDPLTNQKILLMNKSQEGRFSFDDGLMYYFGDAQPEHLRFEIKVGELNKEQCSIRLSRSTSPMSSIRVHLLPYSTEYIQIMSKSDALFFRQGYRNHTRLNLNNQVNRYIANEWYKIDLLINWNKDRIELYIDGKYITNEMFYYYTRGGRKDTFANSLFIYNLTPNTLCYLRQVELCETRCSGAEEMPFRALATNQYINYLVLFSLILLELFL